MRKMLSVLVFASGCAETGVVVTVRPVGLINELAWWSDGPVISIQVENHDNEAHSGTLRCVQDDLGLEDKYPLTIAPHGEFFALGRVINKEVHARPCWFETKK